MVYLTTKAKTMKISYFDRLPDELLVSIMDGLEWKDAAIMSTLSRKFYHVWESFLHSKKDLILEQNKLSCSKHLNFVNHILYKCNGSKVNSLQISINDSRFRRVRKLDENIKNCFRNCVAFARAKCVLSLSMDMQLEYFGYPKAPWFPTFEGFDKLTSLSLSSVSVNDADLEDGLNNHLVNLESLCIKRTQSLKRVVVASQKLKKLVIRLCYNIMSVDIVSAPNLECFIFSGLLFILKLNHVPKLSKVCFPDYAVYPKILSELHKVKMLKKVQMHVESLGIPPHFPLLDNLKELKLRFENISYIPLSNLLFVMTIAIVACPKLHKLELEYNYDLKNVDMNWFENIDGDDTWSSQVHLCLKEVKFFGWFKLDKVRVVNHLGKIAPNAVLYHSSDIILDLD